MITPIDPAEALLAVVGVRPIISREVEKVYRRDLNEANALPRRIEQLARDVCRREPMRVEAGDFHYAGALRDLSTEYKPEQVQAMVQSMPDDLQVAFTLKAAEVFKSLKAKLPMSVVSTLAGARNMLPDDLAVHQFVSELDVLDDPLRVFPGMATGSITKRQVRAVREIYPTISAAIDEALLEAVTNERAAKKTWDLSPHAEIGVGKWSGKPRVSQSLAGAMQKNYVEANKQPPKPPQHGKENAVAKEALSPAQVSAFAGQTK